MFVFFINFNLKKKSNKLIKINEKHFFLLSYHTFVFPF